MTALARARETTPAKGDGAPRTLSAKEALSQGRKAAEQNDAIAYYNLGIHYYYGRGVKRDYRAAYVWFSLSATGGDPEAASMKLDAAKKLSPTDIAEARKQITEWRTAHKK